MKLHQTQYVIREFILRDYIANRSSKRIKNLYDYLFNNSDIFFREANTYTAEKAYTIYSKNINENDIITNMMR